jgi:high-affinity nickel-transport protein
VDALPTAWAALCGLAFALGARHGFDADHLATIDGLARCNATAHPRLARRAGLLFSLGHGAVVLIVAATAYGLASRWRTPAWLETSGVAISVAFLFALAALNLRAVWRAAPDTVVAPVGLKGRLFARVVGVDRPWAIAAVGALFALSFDTISQAALFSLAAGRLGGLVEALGVASLFVLGIVTVDGLNGLWIARLLRRADRAAAAASRIMAFAVAGISLAIGTLALAKWLLPQADAWAEALGPYPGVAVFAGVLVAFGTAMTVASRRRAAAPVRA